MALEIDQTELAWRKATKSATANCLEVAKLLDGSVAVRDSKQLGDGPVLQYTVAEWDAFLDGAKKGEFDVFAE